MDNRGPRERAYDEHIATLMKQIIAACKEHGIPVVAAFELDMQEDSAEADPMLCVTRLVGGEQFPVKSDRMRRAAESLRTPDRFAFAETYETTPTGTRITIRRM